jgi:hypothetical protein
VCIGEIALCAYHSTLLSIGTRLELASHPTHDALQRTPDGYQWYSRGRGAGDPGADAVDAALAAGLPKPPNLPTFNERIKPVPEAIDPKEVAASGEGRIPWQALPVRPLAGAALAMAEGAHKYGRHNYRRTTIKSSVYFDSTLRHFFAWWEGEDIDPKSGLHHIDKTIAGLLVLRDAQLRGMSDDDRPPSCEEGWIEDAGNVFGDMRGRLERDHGAAKPTARQREIVKT